VDKTKYSENQNNTKNQKIDYQKIWMSIKDFDSFWGSLEFLEKKQFLREVIEKVLAGNNRVEVYFAV
jgi:hypothetical protein